MLLLSLSSEGLVESAIAVTVLHHGKRPEPFILHEGLFYWENTMKTTIIDNNALRFNQIAIVVLVLTGFLLDQPTLPAIVGAILLLGVVSPVLSVFRRIYQHVIVPAGLLSPQPVSDDGAAHRFAQLLGGLTLAAASIFLYSGSPVMGWSLAWVVIVLAATNLIFGFCAGCFVFYQIRRLGSQKTGHAGPGGIQR